MESSERKEDEPDIAELQRKHNDAPFFVGDVVNGFWVKNGVKYQEYPG